MSLRSEDVRTQIESPSTQQIVPVQHVSDLIDLDPHSELFLETPPPDVVSSINACFEQFTSTLESRRNASVPKSSDSDSGESLFVTQSVTKAVQTDRRHSRSTKKPEAFSDDIGDDREGVIDRLRKEEDTEYEEGSEGQHTVCPNKGKRIDYLPPRKATFPFILKLHKRRHLPMKKHQILENSEIGGFLKCIKKIQEGYLKTGRAISPFILESEPSDNSEGDDHNSDHEVAKVDKTIFVPSYYKEKKLKWLPQSILENRIQDSLSKGQKDNKERLLAVNGKEKKKTKSTNKNKTSTSVKQLSIKKCKVPKSKAVFRTVSESSCLSLSKKQEKQHETREVLASCSEDSDSHNCRQSLRQIIQSTENLHGNNLVVIEETQGHSVESASGMNQEDGIRSGTDDYLPNKSNFYCFPQRRCISVQNEIQQTDSDIGSVDLFIPLNSQTHKNINHKTASITADMEESDKDSDVPQIEPEGQFDSIFGPGTPKWCDGEHYAHEDNESDITQVKTKGVSVSVFKPRTSTKPFTIQDFNHTKYSEFQMTGQSPFVLHPELLSREVKTSHKSQKRKSMSSSQNDTELTGIETGNVQPSSKHLPLTDEPLREVYSSSCKQRKMVERETDSQGSPLFKNAGKSFIKRKRKKGATILIECDTNVDVSQTVSSVDVTEIEMTRRENRELCNVENRLTNKQTAEESEETSELLEEFILSTVADSSVIKKAKRKKMKMYKLKEREDPEPRVENQSLEVVQFSEPQTTELTLKRTKKKRKDKERTKTACVEEKSASDIPSNETLEVSQSSEIPEAGQPKLMQTSDEIFESVDLNLDASSVSQFDVTGLRAQKTIEKKQSNVAEQCYAAHMLNVAKLKKKSQDASSPSQVDDLIGLENAVLDSQPGNTAERVEKTNASVLSVNMLSSKYKRKKKKRKEQVDAETMDNVDNVHSVEMDQFNESQTSEMTLKTRKKKRRDKEIFACVEENRATGILSIKATETDHPEHLQTLKQIEQYPSPNVTRLKYVKKKNRSEECQYESVDVNLDVSLLDVTKLKEQKMIQRKQRNAAEQFYAAHILNVAKCKKKRQNATSVLDTQSGNPAEHVEKTNSSVISDNMSSKHKRNKKKKKHKLKEQVDAETNSVTHSVDNVCSVEPEQFESQTTDLKFKRTKKKRKAKKIFACVEENSATDIPSIETFETTETDHPEHLQTLEKI